MRLPAESLGYNRSYIFGYDWINRLTYADYGEGSNLTTNQHAQDEDFTFDKMGNVTSIYRKNQGSVIDNVTLHYIGNHLKYGTDAAGASTLYGITEYTDDKDTIPEFYYDANGNLTADLDKNIVTIRYNVLNLPDTIQFAAGHQNYYTYDASGKKLEVQNITSRNILNLPQDTITRLTSSTKLTTDYCGDIIYQNDSLKEILTPEGYWQNGVYYYYLKDHQGNTRIVLNQNNVQVEISHYYPDGMRFTPESSTNSAALPYRYNGKELEAMNGLNEYDYGARRRETGIPVWTTMDPLAEKNPWMSPYAYCSDNPINRIDPDGREWKEKKDEEIAKQLQQQIASRDKSLAKQEQKINAQIGKIGNNTKLGAEKRDQQIAKQQGKLEDVQTQRSQLSNLDKGITQLGDSKTSYTFNTVEAGTTATLSSMSDGTVVINNYGTTGNRAHETTHAIQYDNGQIKFNPLGSNNTLMQNPMGLEIQAYATEYSITNGVVPSSDASYPRTVFGITPQWLYGIKDPNTGIYIYRPENYK